MKPFYVQKLHFENNFEKMRRKIQKQSEKLQKKNPEKFREIRKKKIPKNSEK